jgi:hypothetical protein
VEGPGTVIVRGMSGAVCRDILIALTSCVFPLRRVLDCDEMLSWGLPIEKAGCFYGGLFCSPVAGKTTV